MPTSPSTRDAERAQRLQDQAATKERNRRLAIAGTAIAVVVAVVVALVVAKLASGGSGSEATNNPPASAPSQLVTTVSNVPVAALDAVGAGTASNVPRPVSGASALSIGGKPEVLYVGAEFCPYCASNRWGVVVALSRFGTFANLGLTTSATADVYPDTPTFTFHGATFSSPYVAFRGYELTDRDHATLDTMPDGENAVFRTFDSPPYVPQSSAGSIPFIDIAGRYFLYGGAYDPQVLEGMSHEQIAGALKDPASPVAQAIDGEANLVTAAICTATGQQPATVCSAVGVKAAAAKLGSGG